MIRSTDASFVFRPKRADISVAQGEAKIHAMKRAEQWVTFANILVHTVFSTKGRYPFLNNDELRSKLHACVSKLLKTNVDSPSIFINGMPEHVHILCSSSRKRSVMEVIREIKSRSTTWLKAQCF